MLELIKHFIICLHEARLYPKQTQQTYSETKFTTYAKPNLYSYRVNSSCIESLDTSLVSFPI